MFSAGWQNLGVPSSDVGSKACSVRAIYTLLDLEQLAYELYDSSFSCWFMERHSCADFLFRLADETGIVLLPAAGFYVRRPAVIRLLLTIMLSIMIMLSACPYPGYGESLLFSKK